VDTSSGVYDNKLGVNLAVSKKDFAKLGADNIDNVDLRVEPYAVLSEEWRLSCRGEVGHLMEDVRVDPKSSLHRRETGSAAT